MRYLLFLFLLLPLTAFAQQFQFRQELDSIPVRDGDYQIPTPWTGGFSCTVPAICDIDGDGNLDLFMGQGGGSLIYYQNVGTPSNLSFTFVTSTFQEIQGFGYSVPTFKDIDGDGDYDLLCDFGNEYMRFYRNIGNPTMPQFILEEDSLRDSSGNLIDGSGSTLCDINDDGLLDLFVQQWYSGNIYYYQNVGTQTQFSFSRVSTNFAGVNTGDWCHPKFCDIDADGDYDLFVGDRYGHIHFYRNDGTPRQYDFTPVSATWMNISVGNNASPEFADLDGDGDYDLVVGKDNDSSTPTPPGAAHYYQNVGTPQVPDMQLVTQSFLTFDAGMSSNAELCDVDHDGDLDLFFLTNQLLGWMENVGHSQYPIFEVRSYNLLMQTASTFAFTQLNGDNLPDLIIAGGWSGLLSYWRTTFQNEQLSFQAMGQMDTPYSIGNVTFGDLDGDGQDEMLLGGFENIPGDLILAYYENQSTPGNPNFIFVTDNYQNFLNILTLPTITPWLSDVDLDGDQDLLFLNLTTNTILLYENQGTPQQAQFVMTSQDFLGLGPINPPMFDCGDIDTDGDMDVFAGSYPGGITFFRNVTGDSTAVLQPIKQRPRPSRATLTIGPNPSNPITAIRYQLSVVSLVNLSVYDISGRRVAQLVNGRQNPGEYNVSWNAMGNASGVYLVRLATPGEEVTQKVVVVK